MPLKKKSIRVRKPRARKPVVLVNEAATTMMRETKTSTSAEEKAEIENLVKSGVERFLLDNSTFDDFLRTIRSATVKEYVYSHQLTTSKFSQLVKQAIRKRKGRLKRAG